MDPLQSAEMLGVPREISRALSEESLGEFTKKLGRFLRHVSHPDRGGEGESFSGVGDVITLSEEGLDSGIKAEHLSIDSMSKEFRAVRKWGEIAQKERLELSKNILMFLRNSLNSGTEMTVFNARDFEFSVIDTVFKNSIDPGDPIRGKEAEWRDLLSKAQKRVMERAKSGKTPGEIHETSNIILDEMASYKLIVDSNGELIRVDWNGSRRLENKFLLGCLPRIWFLDLVTPNDYREEKEYRVPLPVSELNASLGDHFKSPNLDARAHFLGSKIGAFADIETGRMDLSNFWRIISELSPNLLRLGYLLSINLPENGSPFIALEGELSSWKPLSASSKAKYRSKSKGGK